MSNNQETVQSPYLRDLNVQLPNERLHTNRCIVNIYGCIVKV